VHKASSQTSRKKQAAGGRYSLRNGDQAIPSRVSNYYITSIEPQVEPVQNSDGKEDSASYQEAPKAVSKASEDVSQPCKT